VTGAPRAPSGLLGGGPSALPPLFSLPWRENEDPDHVGNEDPDHVGNEDPDHVGNEDPEALGRSDSVETPIESETKVRVIPPTADRRLSSLRVPMESGRGNLGGVGLKLKADR
jgi:hypothetical protein